MSACILPLRTVVPRAGTWIETRETTKSDRQLFVVPRAGTWIETLYLR